MKNDKTAQGNIKFPTKFKITKRQLGAIVNAANDLSAMIGGAENDEQWKKVVKSIDAFLNSNGIKRKYK